TIRAGDAVLGFASSGLHTNGYSLARSIFFERMKLKPTTRLAELGNTIGDELLKVHVSYGWLVQSLLKKFNRDAPPSMKGSDKSEIRNPKSEIPVRAFAHITGGGFIDNIPRVLPKDQNIVIRKDSWERPPIFQIIQKKSGVPEEELYQAFN